MWKMLLIQWISNIQFIRASVFLSLCETLRVFMLPAYRKYTALYYQVSLSSPIHIPILRKTATKLSEKSLDQRIHEDKIFFPPKILPGFLDQNLQQQWSCRVPRKGQYCKNNTIYLCERGHFAKVRNDFQFGNPTSLQKKRMCFVCFALVWFCFVCFSLVLFVCLFQPTLFHN